MKKWTKALCKQFNKRLVQFQEVFFRNSYVLGSPFSLVLESGNICNLRCALCPTPQREKRIPKGMLTFENAKKIINEFQFVMSLNMSLWGEPFLNKDIFDIVKYAEDKGIEVLIQSNLNKFNKNMAQKLINAKLSHLMISLDGASQETYEKYRIGGNFNQVIQHIEWIRDLQNAQNNHQTKITWKMVVNKFNEHEVEKAKIWAKNFGINFRSVEIYTPPQLSCDWKPLKKLTKAENVYTDKVELCHSLWQTAVVNFNGDVFPCCSEWSRQDAIGNIFEKPLKKIWNNQHYKNLRKANKTQLNCKVCHIDKETKWYKLWAADQAI